MPRVVVITGLQASGKSTVAPLLADRLGPLAGTLDGDVFHRPVRSGKAVMTPDAGVESERQLALRYEAGRLVARHYVDAIRNLAAGLALDPTVNPGAGQWVDSTEQSPEETVEEILRDGLARSRLAPPARADDLGRPGH